MTRRHQPGPAVELFATLQRTSRVRRWSAAAVLGATAGLFAGLVLDRPLDLFTAVGVTGVALAWDHRHGNLAGWWPVEAGPHRIAALAAHLEPRGWTFLQVPGSSPSLRCLLIGPPGVFVVQHGWDSPSRDVHKGPVGKGGPGTDSLDSLWLTADTLSSTLAELTGHEIVVCPALVVERTTVERPSVVAGVTIVPIGDLPDWLRRRDVNLSQETVESLAAAARWFLDVTPGRT